MRPDAPVTLRWDNGEGQRFTILLTVDDHYMITARQTVANTGTAPVVVQPRAGVIRTSETASADAFNVHSGPIGSFGEGVNFGPDYSDLADDVAEGRIEGTPHWLGFTDIYWLSAVIPQARADVDADFVSLGDDALCRAHDLCAADGRRRAAGDPHHAAVRRGQGKRHPRRSTRRRASTSSAMRSTGAGSAGSRARSGGC